MKTRVIALSLMLCLVAMSMIACQPAQPQNQGAEVTVTVTINDIDGTVLLNETVTFNSDAPTVELAVTEACTKAEIEIVVSETTELVESIGERVLGDSEYCEFKIGKNAVSWTAAIESGAEIVGTIGSL